MQARLDDHAAKVPAITLGFWIIKILATTLGETGGDAVSMSMDLGYLVATAIFAAIFAVALWVQVRSQTFRPAVYWATIVASTTVGTTLADFATRSIGIGYPGGSMLLAALLACLLIYWKASMGTVSVTSIDNRSAETFYWLTITCSQTLGTALGDWTADTAGLGYVGAAAIFSALLLLVVVLHFTTRVSKTALFWAAFVLTRPLGAVVGDFLDKPLAKGGLELSRYSASLALFVAIVLLVWWLPQRAAQRAH